MVEKYKIEKWKKVLWKGTQREQISTVERLVKRDSKGHFAKNTPVIKEVKEKTYGSGVYTVGVYKGKVITRHKIAGRMTPQWQKQKQELKHQDIFRKFVEIT